jgi:hypothetical protein
MSNARLATLLVIVSAPASANPDPALRIAALTGGNLRVDVHCADTWATPERGLDVSIDGVAQRSLGVNSSGGWTENGMVWTDIDVGYAVSAGRHTVEIAAPGCARALQQVDLDPVLPETISGRLATTDEHLLGPTGAPNGLTLVLGAYHVPRASHQSTNDLFSTSYNYDPTAATGAFFSVGYERRGLVLADDFAVGAAPISGMVTDSEQTFAAKPGPYPFAGTGVAIGNTLRVGGRIALHDVALAAGSGLGGDLSIESAKLQSVGNTGLAMAPNGSDPEWYVPLWASLTLKPMCNWGAQVLASYQVHPTALSENELAIGAGVVFQPSASCSERAGLGVR